MNWISQDVSVHLWVLVNVRWADDVVWDVTRRRNFVRIDGQWLGVLAFVREVTWKTKFVHSMEPAVHYFLWANHFYYL